MKKYLITIFLIILAVSLLFIGYQTTVFSSKTFARYKTYGQVRTEVEVAVPILEDTVESLVVPLDEMIPGSTKNYSFLVRNFNDESMITETSMNYTISIESTSYMPLTFELQKDNVESNVLINNISPIYSLTHSISEYHSFKLIISWEESIDDYRLSDLVDSITIIIDGEQKVN